MNRVADCGKSVAELMVLACALAGMCVPAAMAQTICAPQIQWQQSFGTAGWDEPYAAYQTADGGYIIGGTWAQWGAGTGNITNTHQGDSDFLIVRLDAQGQKLWDRSFGGASSDALYALQQTADGGFILGGLTWSGIGGNKTTSTFGSADLWVVRTDASGNKLWDQTFGGSSWDALRSLQQTADGGFILGGYSQSRPGGNKTSPNFGNDDFWIIRLDANGDKIWDRSFGGLETDVLMSLRQTSDGGFILAGPSFSGQSATKTGTNYGQYDFWVVRTDPNGNALWDKTFGGESSDWATAVLEVPGGGFFVAGYSLSPVSGNKTSLNFGETDYWLLRIDSNGEVLWDRSFGGERTDEPESLAPTLDGGCVLAGYSSSPIGGTKQSEGGGYADAWLVRVDPNGNQVWDQSFGGSGYDAARSVQQTRDSGFIVAALSYSTDGDRAGGAFGDADIWIIKSTVENLLDCDNDGVANELDLCPETPFGKIVNSTGCAIDQICPCNSFDMHNHYVTCVRHAAADLQRAGLINNEQRQEIIAQALDARCPPAFDRDSILLFGLEHIPIEGGTLSYELDYPYVTVLPPAPQTNPYGVSVLLGEADSGIFFGVGAPVEGISDPAWYLETRAYGTFKSGPDGLVSTARGTKPGEYNYPVEVDLSPLNPASVTVQYICNDIVQSEETMPGPIGAFAVNSYYYLAPRFNPFWRMPDGSVGALLELEEAGSCTDGSGYLYDRIFVRANRPEREVGHISRVDARAGGGLASFTFWDEWLGVFNRPHRAVGQVLLTAVNDRLTVTALKPSPEGFNGVTIGANKAAHLEVDFLPVDLSAENAAVRILPLGFTQYEIADEVLAENLFVEGIIQNTNDALQVSIDFSPLLSADTGIDHRIRVTAFKNGVAVGSLTGSTSAITGSLTYKNDKLPRITSCTLESGADVSIGIGLDQVATFTASDGTQFRGNHFRFAPVAPFLVVGTLSRLSLHTFDVESLTITDERSTPFAPRMNIVSDAQQVVLSWRDNTRLFAVESGESLSGPFTTITNEVEFVDDRNTFAVPVQQSGPRFFRLRSF